MKLDAATLEGFVSSLLMPHYDEPTLVPECHKEWWEMFCSKHTLVSIAAPRDHAKTTALTKGFGLGRMLFRVSDFSFVVSDTEEQAAEFVTGLGNIIKDETAIQIMFEVDDFEKDTETDIIVVFKDGKKFRFFARGVGQKVRGILWGEKRPNLILIDDLENDKNVQSKEQRRTLKKWVNGALIPSRSKSGIVRAVGTIIHSDSWLASTMPQESSTFTIHTPLKDYSTRLTNGWYSAKYRAHPAISDYSQILWPEHHNADYFVGEYSRLVEDGDVDLYSAEYLNNPIDDTASYFKKSDFIDVPTETRKKLASGEVQLNYYSSTDFAISKAERADYTVIGTIGVDEAGQLYLVDIRRDRFGPDESVDQIFSVEKQYTPGMFLVEKGTLAHAIGAVLNKEVERRKIFPMLTPVATTGDKRTKARGIQKVMRAGGLYVDKQADWYPAFEDELLRFDRGRHDDQVDMMALFGLKLDQLIDAPSQAEREEDKWEAEYGAASLVGKDKVTGY
jgi:predicted phage terminase large subunit-like protein